MDVFLDDFDKKIIVGLAKGLTVKELTKEAYNLKDEGNRAQICYTIVQGKLNLMLWDHQCKTEVQLVIKLVYELKVVDLQKEDNIK